MNIDELKLKAKEAGIKSWHLKNAETLEKELTELEAAPSYGASSTAHEDQFITKPEDEIKDLPELELKIIVTDVDRKFFDSIGLKAEWLIELANKYGFTKFQYMAKFKAFRCFVGESNVDWIDVNDLSLLNGGGRISEIRLKHQPLVADRQVIKMPWRDSTKLKINDPSMR